MRARAGPRWRPRTAFWSVLEWTGRPPEETRRGAIRSPAGARVDLPSDEGQAVGSGEARAGGADVPPLQAFGETSNPAEYVPREASEEALLELERAVRAGRTGALTAPPGFGKSLLLRLLARRLAPGFRCIFLPYAAVTLQEMCAWALGLVGEGAGGDSRSNLLRFVRREAERGEVLVLLIDDASSMPLETAREVGELVRESGNRLRVVLAATDDAISSRAIAALHREIVEVRFIEPMTALETRFYVQTRLEQASVSEDLRGRFNEAALTRIYGLSGGVPRRVHDLARSLLDDAPEGGVAGGVRCQPALSARDVPSAATCSMTMTVPPAFSTRENSVNNATEPGGNTSPASSA